MKTKRFLTALISAMLALVLIVGGVTAFASGGTTLGITADKSAAARGDIVTYTVTLSGSNHVSGGVRCFEFKVNIPDGLTYVDATIDENFGTNTGWTLNSVALVDANTVKFAGTGTSTTTYSGETLTVMTVRCAVDDDAALNTGLTVTIGNAKVYDTSLAKADCAVGSAVVTPKKQFTVTFKDWDGTTLKTETVLDGFAATAPANPSRDGYNFKGWDKDFSNITADTTVTAQYDIRADLSYTVEYREGSASGAVLKDAKTVSGQTFNTTATETAPAIDGYTVDEASKSVTITTGENKIVFIYSKRTDLSYTVEYVDGDGNSLADSKTVNNQTFGASVTENAPAIDGYTVDEASKSVTITTGENKITFTYSKRTDLSYIVEYVDSEGNSIADSKTVNNQTFGASVTENAPTIDGYTISGDAQKSITITTSENKITFTYTLNSYTVTFKNWDGTTLKTESVSHGSAATSPADPSRDGYTFVGWDKDFSNITADTTVTAQYSTNSYTVTYQYSNTAPAGAGALPNGGAKAYGATVAVSANPTAPVGYIFTGWTTADAEVTGGSFTMPSKNVVFYGSWVRLGELFVDDVVDIADVATLHEAVLRNNFDAFDELLELAADVNGNGEIDTADVALLLEAVVNEDFSILGKGQ